MDANTNANDQDDIQVVGFFGPLQAAELREAYRLAVDRLGAAVTFGQVEEPELVRALAKYEDRIVMFRSAAATS